jgi:hypothetical protein
MTTVKNELLAQLIVFLILSIAACGPKDSVLDRIQVEHAVDLPTGDWYRVFSAIKMPYGVEEDRDASSSILHLQQPVLRDKYTARQLLDEMIKMRPAYKWTFQDGTVDIQPRRSSVPTGRNPLDFRIGMFSVRNESSCQAAMEALRRTGVHFQWDSKTGGKCAAISLRLWDPTTRDALNRIAAADGNMGWWVSERMSPEGKTTFGAGMGAWHEDGILFTGL